MSIILDHQQTDQSVDIQVNMREGNGNRNKNFLFFNFQNLLSSLSTKQEHALNDDHIDEPNDVIIHLYDCMTCYIRIPRCQVRDNRHGQNKTYTLDLIVILD